MPLRSSDRKFTTTTTLLLALGFVPPSGVLAQHTQDAQLTQAKPELSTGPAPAYDVAAIKPDNSGSGSSRVSIVDDTFIATNVSFKSLLAEAYGIKPDLITGGPGWVNSAHYDINAKVLEFNPEQMKGLSGEQRNSMLRKLLEDRFHMQVHKETKILPIYEMVVAKGGPKLNPTPHDLPVAAGEKNALRPSFGIWVRDRQMTAKGVTMESLAAQLFFTVHRSVIDKTGLPGQYDFTLAWAPDDGSPSSADSTAPSIFTALQEQLGLKLESAKGPVETLVIDHVQPPTEN